MKVVSITIVLEPDDTDAEVSHATRLEFKDGMWQANGPVFNRITEAMAEIWKLLRGAR